MVKAKRNDNDGKIERRYWSEPKIPIGLRISKDLVERAKKAARLRKVPFTAIITSGIERELFAIYKEYGGEKAA